jgi:pimeloyl-ACP methyl ester carboxylesterase
VTVERWTTRSGPRIRYLDNAPSAPIGLPILFSPGLSDFADEYDALLDDVAPRRLLVVEVRGRGSSEAPATGYATEDHAADLRAVLDEEGIDRFHLMTFSRGTTWGLELAATMPERVASLSIGDYLPAEVALPSGFADEHMQGRFRGKPMAERLPHHVLSQIALAARGRDLFDVVRALTCPLLIAQPLGEQRVLSDAAVERYRSARPDIEVVPVPGADHDIFRPDRLLFGRAVVDLIDRRCPAE